MFSRFLVSLAVASVCIALFIATLAWLFPNKLTLAGDFDTPGGSCPLPANASERLIITVTKIENKFYRHCVLAPAAYFLRPDARMGIR